MKASLCPPEPAARKSPASTLAAQLYFRADALLGEGPVWEVGTLYWVDTTGKVLFAKRDGVVSAQRYDLGLEVGSFALWKDNRLVLGTERGFQAFDLVSRQLEPWANPEPTLPDNRLNDGKCDPRGRFVAGSMNRRGAGDQGALYLLDHDRSVRELYRPVSCSNGLAWSATGTVLYYIDTPTCRVRAFAYDLESGRLSQERVVIEIPQAHGRPDGLSIDRAGNLWIALWDGWAVECWSPVSGRCLARIEVPVARVTSCTFGGEDYDTLFITTARHGLDGAALARQELAGSVFCVRPGVAGYPAVRFQGDFKLGQAAPDPV